MLKLRLWCLESGKNVEDAIEKEIKLLNRFHLRIYLDENKIKMRFSKRVVIKENK